LPNSLGKILREIIPHGYYVGGIVRSSLLKRQSGDIDIALPAADVKRAAYDLGARLHGAVFEMDAEMGVWRVVTHDDKIQIDLTAYQGKNLREDLLRRDFTFNALAYPVSACPRVVISQGENGSAQIILKNIRKNLIVDETGGLEDLARKIIRTAGENQFTDDPLRMLRALRCAAELGFTIEPRTLAQIKAHAPLITQSAGERRHEELTRLFNTKKSYRFLVQMDELGLLTALFPELEAQRACAEVYYGKGGVLKHTLAVCNRMEYLLNHLEKAFPKYAKKIAPFIKDQALFKMTALLHDVAKPATAKVQGDRLRFFYHEQKGAKMAREILERLHYSRAEVRLVCAMIGEHLRPSNLASNDIITDRGAYHFFRDLGEAGVPLLLLCWADYTSYVSDAQLRRILPKSAERMMTLTQAARTKNVGKTLRHLQVLSLLLCKYFDAPQKIAPTRIITGVDVMTVLGLPPSPKIGEILEAVAVAQVEGKVVTRQDALSFIKKLQTAKK
jgi:poly(A) polymerase